MNSMTGYGRGEVVRRGFKVTVEVSSVNRKQMEVGVNLPRDLEVLEAQIRDEIHRRVSRGRITVRVSVQASAQNGLKSHLDLALAKSYARDLRALAKTLRLEDAVTLDLLARLPGVVQPAEGITEAEALWPVTSAALGGALTTLVKMRQREGGWLARDLKSRVVTMRRGVARIQQRAPQATERYREQLLRRIREAGLQGPAVDDERLLKEAFYFADRADISRGVDPPAKPFPAI